MNHEERLNQSKAYLAKLQAEYDRCEDPEAREEISHEIRDVFYHGDEFCQEADEEP